MNDTESDFSIYAPGEKVADFEVFKCRICKALFRRRNRASPCPDADEHVETGTRCCHWTDAPFKPLSTRERKIRYREV